MGTDVVAASRRDLLAPAALRLAPDERLVAQVLDGSERAFEVLFDRHYRSLFAYCRHLLRSPEEAEDVVQQTFLAAYRELVDLRQPIASRAWLYTIARHRCLSALRAAPRRTVENGCEPAAAHLVAEAITREELRAVFRDVSALPDDQRVAFVLTELGDVSHEEIAGMLGCPREKVKALVFQARSSLATSRVARDTPCAEICQQIATRRGASLRRAVLRRHLQECPACRAFRDAAQVQRRKLTLLLPLAPAGALKRALIGALTGSRGGLSGGAAMSAGALSGTGVVVAALATVAIPTAAAITELRDARQTAHPASRAAPALGATQALASTHHTAALLQVTATNVAERRGRAGGDHDNSDPTAAKHNTNAPGAPGRAAAPNRSERASRRAEMIKPSQRSKLSARPNAHRVTPPRANRPMKPRKPPKRRGRGKPAEPPNAMPNAKVRHAEPPKTSATGKPAAPAKTDVETKRSTPPQSSREPRAAQPPKANAQDAPAKPPDANGRSPSGKLRSG